MHCTLLSARLPVSFPTHCIISIASLQESIDQTLKLWVIVRYQPANHSLDFLIVWLKLIVLI